MAYQADIAVRGPDGGVVLVVEVKGGAGRGNAWAARQLEHAVAQMSLPSSLFYLLATPDKFFLWKNGGRTKDKAAPDYIEDAAPSLAPYLGRSGLSPGRMSHDTMETLISSWLSRLQSAWRNHVPLDPGEEWVEKSGLLKAISGGQVEVEATV